MRPPTSAAALVAVIAIAAGGGCGEGPPADPALLAAAGDQASPTGRCGATWSRVADEGHPHVPPGTELSPATNPPASGPHYPTWATWGVHEQPVPRGYYLHNLEHGGVVLLYRCEAEDGCPEVAAALTDLVLSLPVDPACDPAIARRIVITPDPLIDAPVAAAAWGHIYRADCVDPETLGPFVQANGDQAPESICAQGEID